MSSPKKAPKYKLKRLKSATKRIFFTGTGKVKAGCGRRRHNMRKRNPRMLRSPSCFLLKDCDIPLIKKVIRY